MDRYVDLLFWVLTDKADAIIFRFNVFFKIRNLDEMSLYRPD